MANKSKWMNRTNRRFKLYNLIFLFDFVTKSTIVDCALAILGVESVKAQANRAERASRPVNRQVPPVPPRRSKNSVAKPARFNNE